MNRTYLSRLRRWRSPAGLGWLAATGVVAWAVATIYLPIVAPFLSPGERWGVAGLMALLMGLSLWGHAAAHGGAGRAPLYPFGEAAQVWPAAATARREVLAALAGPLANLLMAGLAYLVWNAQLHPYLNASMFFLIFFNLVIAGLNLTPAFPFDGGRLVRAIGWGLLQRPVLANRLALRLGLLYAGLLAGWGLVLLLQGARFSGPTGGATLVLAGLVLLALRRTPAWQWNRPEPANRLAFPGGPVRAALALLLFLALLAAGLSLVLTNSGLEAPGFAVPVEPMVTVPADLRREPAGSFILTSVIPQAPITAGQWLHGQLSPAIRIMPPERIVPPDRTAQEIARQQYQMLEESQRTAIAVGLEMAGYPVTIEGRGARVVEILPDSPANGLLQAGDVITGLNGEPVRTTAELIDLVGRQDPGEAVALEIERPGRAEPLAAAAPLMPPAEPGGPPRIGIVVESAGFAVDLPFPAAINPQKISGGPSAGLMFTLTVYNLVTPEDLTGGRLVAGTGTISPDGAVGRIGGVQQKVAAAERAGADYFLSPPENFEEAAAAARQIEVVEVATAAEAVKFLEEK